MSVLFTIVACIAALSLAGLFGAIVVIRHLFKQIDDSVLEPVPLVIGEFVEVDKEW